MTPCLFTLAAFLVVAWVHAGETLIAANDPRITYLGRTRVNGDGSRTFDWEATSVFLNVANTSYIKAIVASSEGGRTRFVVDEPTSSQAAAGLSNGFVLGTFWVDGIGGALSNNTYYAASGLVNDSNYTLRMFNDLEPLYHGSSGQGYGSGQFTFYGFLIDGIANPASPASTRRIEWVGDSITAGFGSRGVTAPCLATSYSASNYYSYSRYLCDDLGAACACISWSGKGMWLNCCDDGETMPSLFRQTLGSDSYTTDWDFSQFIPSALAINLGSNDFSKYNNTQAWIAEFVAVYTAFVINATTLYYKIPSMPVLLVQGPFNNTQLFGALQTLVTDLQAAHVDAHYVSAIVTTGNPDGCQGHPGQTWHPAMAAAAKPQIKAILGW